VISCLGVRSLSFTACFRRLMLQYSARSEISTNLSTSKISCGICFFPININVLVCFVLFVSVASFIRFVEKIYSDSFSNPVKHAFSS